MAALARRLRARDSCRRTSAPALEAHLEGCAECRAEADSLGATARLLPLADPERFGRPAPQPSPQLAERIAATIGGERTVAIGAAQRRRFGFALSGAAAVAAVALAIFVLPGGGEGEPVEHVEFASTAEGHRRSTRRWSRTPTAPRSTCT